MARRASVWLLGAAIVCAAQLCPGAEPGPSYEHLKFLEPLVGNWKVVLKEGERIVSNGQEKSEWILNKSFMKQVGWGQIDNQPLQYEFRNGWNPKTQEVFQWAIGATDGGYATCVRTGGYDPATGVWTSRDRTIVSDGTQHTSKVELQVVDQDSYKMAFSERRADNVAAPDQHSSYSRAPAVAAPALDSAPGPGYEHLKFLDFAVGKWKLEGTVPGVGKAVGEEVNTWIYDKNFTHTKGWGKVEGGDRVDYELLMGWDPVKQKVVMWAVSSDGSFGTREGVYKPETKCLISQERGIDSKGVESSATVEAQLIDNDHFVLKFSALVQGGKPQPDFEAKATRIGP